MITALDCGVSRMRTAFRMTDFGLWERALRPRGFAIRSGQLNVGPYKLLCRRDGVSG